MSPQRAALGWIVTTWAVAGTPAAQAAPRPESLDVARAKVDADLAAELARVLVDAKGAAAAARLLVARAKAQPDAALRWLLFEHAVQCAVAGNDVRSVRRVIGEFAAAFRIDTFSVFEDALRRLARTGAATSRELAFAALDLATFAVTDGNTGRRDARLATAAELALRFAKRDRVLTRHVRAMHERHRMQASAWAELVGGHDDGGHDDGGHDDGHDGNDGNDGGRDDGAARGRYLCFVAGDWQRGLPMLEASNPTERNILAKKGGARDFQSCLSVAESWLARRKAFAGPLDWHALARRNLALHALSWYYRAFPSSKGMERERLIAQMGKLEDRLFAAAEGPGFMRFGKGGARQMVVNGGEWKVENGRLVLRNLGPAMSATCRFAFSKIRSVTIRGGILSKPNRNFRFAVGPLNALCNWEVRPENRFFLGGHWTDTKPPLFQAGREHELRVRQLGDEIVFFFDGKIAFRGAGKLAGTVSIYASLKSEIFATEILIDGDVDPHTPVDGPLRELW